MANKLTSTVSITINAHVSNVWRALTDPDLIKEYLFGTNTISDWKKNSPIVYKGEWQGKSYEDKGIIVDIIPEKLLHTTYFSSMSGKVDKPENYANVIYSLEPKGEATQVTIVQDNITDEAQVHHMEENWGTVLAGMKKLLEKPIQTSI